VSAFRNDQSDYGSLSTCPGFIWGLLYEVKLAHINH
jgi:hypothetical protein